MEYTGSIQAVYRECTGSVQGVYRECTGSIQGVYRESGSPLSFRRLTTTVFFPDIDIRTGGGGGGAIKLALCGFYWCHYCRCMVMSALWYGHGWGLQPSLWQRRTQRMPSTCSWKPRYTYAHVGTCK